VSVAILTAVAPFALVVTMMRPAAASDHGSGTLG
jgi:hypothetical protein